MGVMISSNMLACSAITAVKRCRFGSESNLVPNQAPYLSIKLKKYWPEWSKRAKHIAICKAIAKRR